MTEVEGLRAWVAQLDRKLSLRTYLTLAASLLALACSIVAVVLAFDARDNAASSDDIARLEGEIAALQSAAATEAEVGVGSTGLDQGVLEQQLTAVEDQVEDLQKSQEGTDQRVAVIEDDIDDLRSQISNLQP